jgi:hypothetical protein
MGPETNGDTAAPTVRKRKVDFLEEADDATNIGEGHTEGTAPVYPMIMLKVARGY